ncbi:MAG: HNH endonuclease [Pseudomonadota bacterium]
MKKLHFTRLPSHAALRAFVYQRDGFCCQWCGVSAPPPPQYDGKDNVLTGATSKQGWDIWFVVDHVVSMRNGGSNHPQNLQMLCDPCNSAKSGLVDSKVGK